MPMAAGLASPTDRAGAMGSTGVVPMQSPPLVMMSDAFAKDAIIAWFRGEFAAANAMIDALCGHLSQVSGGGGEGSEYEKVFAAIHRRRLNWISVLQMQKYHSIAEVALELRNVAERKVEEKKGGCGQKIDEIKECLETEKLVENGQKTTESEEKCGVDEETVVEEDDSPNSDITDSGK